MKALLGCLILVLIGGCTHTVGIDWSQQRNMQMQRNSLEDRLLFEQNGWQVWSLYKQRKMRCIALKPAAGRPWPEFIDDYSAVTGGAGFYMLAEEKKPQQYFGFYGAHAHGKIARAWRRSDAILEINNRVNVLGWEGETLDFEITSQPQADVYTELLTLSGQLDFTGVQQAYEAFSQCHLRIQ